MVDEAEQEDGTETGRYFAKGKEVIERKRP